jgi:predicted nucleic acid-binding protein
VRAVLNASPIIAILDEIGEPQIFVLLAEAGWELLVPAYVAHEEIRKSPGRERLFNLIGLKTIALVENPAAIELEAFLAENPNLDPGESCVILVAQAMCSGTVPVAAVLDEGPARKRAQELGLPVVGTIGLLRWLEERNVVSRETAQRLRQALTASSFRIGQSVVSRQEDRVT